MKQALGLIETVGLAAAIEAADTAVKSANVTLVGYEMTRGNGMITIKLLGDVGAVKAAVTAAVMAANRVNEVYSYHVIPRPHAEIDGLINQVDRGPGRGGPTAEPVPLGSNGGDGGTVAPAVEAAPGAAEAAAGESETVAQAEAEGGVTGSSPLAIEAAPQRCQATTLSGTRCRNRAQPGSAFCHIHEEATPGASFEEEE